MNSEELIGLIPAAGKGVRLGLPYPKELYPVIRDNHYKPISAVCGQQHDDSRLAARGLCHQRNETSAHWLTLAMVTALAATSATWSRSRAAVAESPRRPVWPTPSIRPIT